MVLRGFMTRSLVIVPLLFGCSVGAYGEQMMMGTDGSMMAERTICVPKIATPKAAHNHALAGANPAGPRSGSSCMAVGGCHGAQPGSTVFTFAGTAYKEMGTGTTPAAGVTVRLFMPGGQVALAKTDTDAAGNFYTNAQVTFPAGGLETDITGCGSMPNDIIPMISPVRQNEANCSSSQSCHIVPGPRPVYLP